MTLDKMPLFAWAMLVFAVMIIIAFPAVILATLLLELERAFNWPFFDRRRAAATRCCGSTCSGSSATPKSTSSSCPPPAWCR